jgi:fatty acid desaturase (delta-4 desaturase)
MAAFIATQGIVLAATFAVSHNVPEAKVAEETDGAAASRDWGRQQVLTSADWGGVVGNFFTGGLNLQVEHHLFPAVCFVHYPAIAKIVKDECAKRDVPYFSYDTLPQILRRFIGFMAATGAAEQRPMRGRVDFAAAIDSKKDGGRSVPMPGQSGCPVRFLA